MDTILITCDTSQVIGELGTDALDQNIVDTMCIVTEVFPSDDPYLDEDAVFGVREKLIMEYQEMTDVAGIPADLAIKDDIDGTFFKVDFDFVLASA